jgi:hypothetical protein
LTDNYEIPSSGVTLPEAGIYFNANRNVRSFYLASAPFPSIKTIDEKYVPDTIATKEYVDEKIGSGSGGASAVPDEEMLDILMEMDIVQPISNTNGAVFTDANNKVYVL